MTVVATVVESAGMSGFCLRSATMMVSFLGGSGTLKLAAVPSGISDGATKKVGPGPGDDGPRCLGVKAGEHDVSNHDHGEATRDQDVEPPPPPTIDVVGADPTHLWDVIAHDGPAGYACRVSWKCGPSASAWRLFA